jgi:hypothetical protein
MNDDAHRAARRGVYGESDLLTSWIDNASSRVRQAAEHIFNRNPNELMDDLTRLSRERPGMFLAGAFLVGVGVARLVKSATTGQSRTDSY